ncbi:MAG: bifunctional (p)ppGpp synthetase/guanosine-3',5'-bis(diphosphate) 3'-pyrophosphohydrolase [Bacteroidaceae bacterium]|nr:bifunctional (p)ppGpp synthetase/guanosine-3',5'-bis(diphosphate) 3'-pyrophosphohydrolase [Bacteroidaceae bacterium]
MDKSESVQQSEEQMIRREFDVLLNGYLNSNHRKKVEIIERAFNFANEAHKGVRRRSGEPYILHPLAVARIVNQEMGLGSTSICAALLHDVVEDTDYTVEDIENLFGKKIAQIVSGLTKISGGIFGDKASVQAENFRKLLLTMSEDIRVILIKMADRLHNMRTLGSMAPNKQYKIAGETLYIYAPLAHRLGLFAVKTELEDLSFKYEHPDAYNEISKKIEESEINRQQVYQNFAAPIKEKLDEMGIKYEMKARLKSVYSIWSKMQTKNIPFEEVYDLYAVRIIFTPSRDEEEKKECWNIYSVITDIYKLHPERIRDWVSRPKANGYRALHVTVMGPDGNWIEVQIRSRKMDEIAERGFAAHWKYKVGGNDEESELDKWLKTIKEILENPEPNALDFLDTIKLNLFASEIFVFTPKGDLKVLPMDATALDFAFTLHSEMGYHCIAAKVNHKLAPLSQKLQSGDQIEILTSKSQTPKDEWLNFVTTAKARTKLLAALRKDKKQQMQTGEKLLEEFFEKNKLKNEQENVDKILLHYALEKKDDLLCKVGRGDIILDDSLKKLFKEKSENVFLRYWRNPFGSGSNSKNQPTLLKQEVLSPGEKINRKETYILKEDGNRKNYTIATCCSPIPGDDVLGYVNENEQVIVHKRQCPIAMRLKSSFGQRLVDARWDEHSDYSFPAVIEIKGIDGVGVLNEITRIVSGDMSVNIKTLKIDTQDGLFQGILGIMVHDVKDIENLCVNIKKVKNVKSANRISI